MVAGLPSYRSLVVDVGPSVVIAVIAGHELSYNHVGVLDWVLAQALVWSLVVRRRAPEVVLVASLLLAGAIWLRGDLILADLGVLVALHAVASLRPLARALAAAAVVEAGAIGLAVAVAPTGSSNDAVVLLSGVTMSALLLGTTQRTSRLYLVALEDRAEQLERQREQKALMAAAAERTRIAREMHDIVAHHVSVMIALSEGAAATPDQARARSTMRTVAATGRQALDELRQVLSVLRTEDATPGARDPAPTVGSIDELAAQVRLAGLTVDLSIDPAAGDLPEAMQATIYRIVQESLTNTLKHARRATRASVAVEVGADEVAIAVGDDGRPTAPSEPGADPVGNGVRGMSERAGAFRGVVEARATPAGWRTTCTMPRPVRADP